MNVLEKLLFICICVSLALSTGCGKSGDSGESKTSDTGKTSEKKAPEVKKELKVTLKAGDKEIALKGAKVRNDAMTPGDDSHDYSIHADPAEGEGGLALSFEYTKDGGAKNGYCTIKGYKVKSVSVKVESLEWKKGTYGGKTVTSVKGSYTGKLQMRGDNGFPTGDPIDFSGTFEK